MQKRKGFTFLELLIAIAILFVLCGFLFPVLRRIREQSRQVVCISHLRQIGQAALMYCGDNEGYFYGLSGAEPTYGGPMQTEWVYWESSWTPPFNDPQKSPILKYLSHDLSILRCPSDDPTAHTLVGHPMFGTYPFSYAMNFWTCIWPSGFQKLGFPPMIPAYRLQEVHNPSEKVFFLEEDPRYIDDGAFLVMLSTKYNWSEVASYVHDTNRSDSDPNQQVAGVTSGQLDHNRRTNAVFCDGHAEFITQSFLEERSHYDPRD